MKATLFKHEFKRTWLWLALIALALALVVGVSLAAGFLLPGPFNTLIAGFGMVLAIATPMAVQLLLGLDFYRSSYSKTGYFTMTLPVKGSTTFWVKFGYASLVALIFLAYGAAMALVAGMGLMKAMAGSADGYWAALGEGVRLVLDLAPSWLVVLGIVVVLLIPVSGLAHHFFAAAVGSEASFNRMGFGGVVLVWFLYYVASQLVTMVGILLPLTFTIDASGVDWLPNPLEIFTMGDTNGVLPMGAFVTMLILAAVAIWRTKVSFDRKVELR